MERVILFFGCAIFAGVVGLHSIYVATKHCYWSKAKRVLLTVLGILDIFLCGVDVMFAILTYGGL